MTDPGGTAGLITLGKMPLTLASHYLMCWIARQGIEHVVAHEQGLVMHGMVIAAGDSHDNLWCIWRAGLWYRDVGSEHLLATQTLVYRKLKTMRVSVRESYLSPVPQRNIVLEFSERIGADGATGYAIEFVGEAISALKALKDEYDSATWR